MKELKFQHNNDPADSIGRVERIQQYSDGLKVTYKKVVLNREDLIGDLDSTEELPRLISEENEKIIEDYKTAFLVISEKEALQRMRNQCSAKDDEEMNHIHADKILCEVLDSLGYTKLTKRFKGIEKWYC